MTRQFNGNVSCPSCGFRHSSESAFDRWLRQNPLLDSQRIGVVVFNCDLLIHRYVTPMIKGRSRNLQCLMFVEVKTFGSEVTTAQRDSLSLLSQVLRNRRNIRRKQHAKEHSPPAKAYSHMLKRMIGLRMFGGHLLEMSGACPLTSGEMKWDGKPINTLSLLSLLRFESDPDTLRPMDWRSHHDHDQREFTFMNGVVLTP